jgi:sulfonate dioxygenase
MKVVTHSATLDYWPSRRHGLRVTPQGERPISVADYERTTGKRALDRQLDLWEHQGIQQPERKDSSITRAYRD